MNMQPATVQHNLFILSNHVSSFSLSADVFARSSSDWGRQTDQHALAVFCLCDNECDHETSLRLLTALRFKSLHLGETLKQSDKSLSISLLSLCVFSDCGWMWEGQKEKRISLSLLLGRGISYAYMQVCFRACEQWIWSTAVACGGILNIQILFDVYTVSS